MKVCDDLLSDLLLFAYIPHVKLSALGYQNEELANRIPLIPL
jgi:hypothetical protein